MELYNEREIAELLKCKVKTLQAWRHRGGGPPYCVVGAKLIRYRLEDVKAYLDSRITRSTSDAR